MRASLFLEKDMFSSRFIICTVQSCIIDFPSVSNLDEIGDIRSYGIEATKNKICSIHISTLNLHFTQEATRFFCLNLPGLKPLQREKMKVERTQKLFILAHLLLA